MMCPVASEVRFQINSGDRALEQVNRPSSHMATDLRLGQRRQLVASADVIHAVGDRLVTVDQGAVEIEDDGFQSRGEGTDLDHSRVPPPPPPYSHQYHLTPSLTT